MPTIPTLDEAQLEAVCRVLADTGDGLTGSEISRLLGQCGIGDPEPTTTKWCRLHAALGQRQRRDGCGNAVLRFIAEAMAPVRYAQARPGSYEDFRHRLNKALAFCGYTVAATGQLERVTPARTLEEAGRRADRLRSELERRCVHHDVLAFCRPELLADDYFHAVLEATKSVAQKIREKTGLGSDGCRLVEDAFGYSKPGYPMLALNTLRSESDESEHRGFMALLKGMFQMFRNPTAHDPRLHRDVGEGEALDLLSLVSFLHRRLDVAVQTGQVATAATTERSG